MNTTRTWKFPTALMMAGSMAIAAATPLLTSLPVAAQPSPQLAQLFRIPSRSVGLRQGTYVPVYYAEAERLIILPDETEAVEWVVAADVYSERGTIIIREGSRIRGEMRPVEEEEGTQFVASDIVLAGSDRSIPIEAVSGIFTQTETISRRTDPDYLRGAAIGTAASAVISEIFGRVDALDLLAGAGLGVLAEVLLRRDREVEVFVIEPDSGLDLVLVEDFVLNSDASTRRLYY